MIDWARVCELRDEIGAEDFEEVAELFLTEVSQCIADLPAARSPAVLRERMHALKGASLNLGFAALADICRAGERAAAQGDMNAVRPAEVRNIFAASLAAFEAEFARRFAA
ncbi:Hpt domain-containing protein [Citreimonas salinaria]|uniref:Hpt domain-containing protein n=1 Tax=Citreimonas salinaria TaxID=321339 RepID=A0A1H3FE69_9RHOB|nr:Hpt domain-containing protein [Citreimonas salinaria]SDX88419.1 Hpt domain-containing protein [Citreimonas salinaria]